MAESDADEYLEAPFEGSVRVAPLLFLLAACTGGKDDPDDTGLPQGDCDATLTMSDAVTSTGMVTWSTDAPGRSWVEYGPNVTLGWSTVPGGDDLNDHTVLLAGLPTSSSWFWQAVTETADGTQLRCTMQLADIGARPRGMPSLDITEGPTPDVAPGFRILSSQIGDSFTTIVNSLGEDVWWWPEAEHTVVQRSYVSADGTSITRMTANDNFSVDESMLYKLRLDGEPLSETRIPMGHHDFVELPDDPTYAYAYLAAVVEPDAFTDESGTYDVVGDSIVEISEDGTQSRTVWSSWDSDVPLIVDPATDEGFYSARLDWTHANALQYLPDTDSYLISLRNLDIILLVNRADGAKIWQFGGAASDFEVQSGRVPDGQHSAELVDATHLMMFDNGPHEDSWSQAIEFELDLDAGTANEVWSYDGGRDNTSILLGDVERLPNGNTAIAWGSTALFTEVTAANEEVLRLDTEMGHTFGYVKYVDAIGGHL